MRYASLPRIKYTPPKGTSRRKRKRVQRLADILAFIHGPAILAAAEKASMDSLLYGSAYMSVSWDNDLVIKHEYPPPIYPA